MSKGLRRWLKSVVIFDGRSIAWPRVDTPAAWGVAAVLIAAGFFAKPLLERAIGDDLPPYITMYGAVVVAALLGGPRIGVVTALITVLLAWYFFLPPYGSFTITSPSTAVALCLYVLLSSFQGWIVGKARTALDALALSEARRDRAARESVHRIKNLIAVVQGITAKLSREVQTTAEFKTVLSSRLVALGSAQDVLVQSSWSDVELVQIVRAALAPFLPNPGLEIRNGPAVLVPARHVSGLNMALYELCTNSLKYGALAEGRGPVVLSWRTDDGHVVLEWEELTPQPVVHDEGLGTQLIRYALGNDENCQVAYVIDGMRIAAHFKWPAVPWERRQTPAGSLTPGLSHAAGTGSSP